MTMTNMFEQYKKLKSLQTVFGKHSKKKLRSLETVMGKHSKGSKTVNESVEDLDSEEHSRIHNGVAKPNDLSDTEKDSIVDYTDDSSRLNRMLHRHYNGSIIPEKDIHKEKAKKITDILNKHSISDDIKVYTGLKTSPSEYFDEDHSEPTTVHLPAFTSTSTSKGVASHFSENTLSPSDDEHNISYGDSGAKHVLEIHVPKGTSGMSVKSISMLPSENEVLLNRGHEIEIHHKPKLMKRTESGDPIYLWKAKIVGHNPEKL